MIERRVEIINKLGLHARAAAKLVNTATAFLSETQIEFAGQTADAKSIMSVMMLAASKGSQITLRCNGDDEEQAMASLVDLISNYFEEGE